LCGFSSKKAVENCVVPEKFRAVSSVG